MILVNGVATESVAAGDRGLAYGDGVFRTFLTQAGVPQCWRRQFQKLAHDCAALGIACPADAVLADDIAAAASAAPLSVVKIIVTRGEGTRGYAPTPSPSPTRVVMASPPPEHPRAFTRSGVKVHWCQLRFAGQPRLAGIKHLNRLENVLARAEWSDPEIAEGLVRDEDGSIVGGTMTNLFIVEGSSLVTPPLSRCGVAGVTRDRIMEAAATQGLSCREEPVTQARLQDANEALLVNSVIGVWPVRECCGKSWKPGPGYERVREWLNETEH